MRVFVAGPSGSLGTRLVSQLTDRGHEVVGTYHSPRHDERVTALGAASVQLDLLDAAAVLAAVSRAEPDAVVHQATALAQASFGRRLDRTFAATNRLRTTGTDALVAAAQAVRVPRLVAQSFAPYRYDRSGALVKTEQDRLDPNPPASARETFTAMNYLDETVTRASGIVLRYGGFYGGSDPAKPGRVRRAHPRDRAQPGSDHVRQRHRAPRAGVPGGSGLGEVDEPAFSGLAERHRSCTCTATGCSGRSRTPRTPCRRRSSVPGGGHQLDGLRMTRDKVGHRSAGDREFAVMVARDDKQAVDRAYRPGLERDRPDRELAKFRAADAGEHACEVRGSDAAGKGDPATSGGIRVHTGGRDNLPVGGGRPFRAPLTHPWVAVEV